MSKGMSVMFLPSRVHAETIERGDMSIHMGICSHGLSHRRCRESVEVQRQDQPNQSESNRVEHSAENSIQDSYGDAVQVPIG
jgi:hypothetical protein